MQQPQQMLRRPQSESTSLHALHLCRWSRWERLISCHSSFVFELNTVPRRAYPAVLSYNFWEALGTSYYKFPLQFTREYLFYSTSGPWLSTFLILYWSPRYVLTFFNFLFLELFCRLIKCEQNTPFSLYLFEKQALSATMEINFMSFQVVYEP